MALTALRAGLVLLAIFLGVAKPAVGERDGDDAVCPTVSVTESSLRSLLDWCPSRGFSSVHNAISDLVGVTEGDEVTLQKALNTVEANRNEYIAMLFYASWCPFSRACRPNFNALSVFFPTIRHFSFEESLIRPSILSGYGVHGFPTLFLLNSTMRVRYHGSRALNSLIAFYSDVSGIQPIHLDPVSMETFVKAPSLSKLEEEDLGPEKCPFSWARSPEKFLQQEAYLALAVAFLLSRSLYLLLPRVVECFKRTSWRRHMCCARFTALWQAWRPLAGRNAHTRSSKRGNLWERAMNAKMWTSKSLVSVAVREPPSSVSSPHSGLGRR